MNEQIPEWLKQEAERKYPCPEKDEDIAAKFEYVINKAKQEAYIAGALSRSGGVWVKASERLPDEGKKVFFIFNKEYYRAGRYFHFKDYSGWKGFKVENSQEDFDDSNFDKIEWLDESSADNGDAIDGWISVEKEFPPIDEDDKWNKENNISKECIVWHTEYGMKFGTYYYNSGRWSMPGHLGFDQNEITHWMLLQPPQSK